MTAGGDQLNGSFEAVSEFTRAAIAEGAALKQHQAFAGGEGRCSRFLEGLEGLARFSAIEAAEVEAAPAWIDAALDQAVDGPIPRCRVISPDQMDGHGLMMAWMVQGHPIVTESVRRIRNRYRHAAANLGSPWDSICRHQKVLNLLIKMSELMKSLVSN